jgi:S-adenosylmethionine:tRNA ribosyltransferase-isomerase
VSTAPAEAERLEAHEPARDAVRLMVARAGEPLVHARFRDLPDHLRPGDLLVVNESATIPAALDATREDGSALTLHLSTPEPRGDAAGWAATPSAPRGNATDGVATPSAKRGDAVGGAAAPGGARRWVVELRRGAERFRGARAGERLALPGGGAAELVAPYLSPGRLWIAALDLPAPLDDYLAAHGRPIRYGHELRPRPLADHQTMFAAVPGSAEMPSAGRPFTPGVVRDLAARGIGLATILLHTGVSSQERGERPYPERFAVGATAAARVNAARGDGGRVIAVGTTVARALESAAAPDGTVAAAAGWTSLTITPERGVRAIDGLITGWHEPDASHLLLLEAVAGRELVERSYSAAVAAGYRWHEFGDSHLLL